MKAIAISTMIVTIALLAGCNPEDTTETTYQTAYITTGGTGTQGGFDFSEGVVRHDTLADMVIEPWWDNGEPAPAIQHIAWGDSTKKIIDLGQINLEDVIDLDPNGMIPDTTTQSDMWDVTKPMKGHAYYITTLENNDAFFFIDSIKITRDSNFYTTDLWIKYLIK